jgi:hypothetical protein
MLKREEIRACFEDINEALRAVGQKGEIGIVGGAVMCLVYNARESTRDVDAIFEPAQLIRDLAKVIGQRRGLQLDWLNDAAKGFLVEGFSRETVMVLSNLLVWAPDARYMLAMKCISARWDSSDKDDVIYLLNFLKIKDPEVVFSLIESYYPKCKVPAKTKFFLEEILTS